MRLSRLPKADYDTAQKLQSYLKLRIQDVLPLLRQVLDEQVRKLFLFQETLGVLK